MTQQIIDIQSALPYIDNSDRDTWITVGMALKAELGDQGFDLWNSWSRSADSYNDKHLCSAWRSFKSGGVKIGSLFYKAKQSGWKSKSKIQHLKPVVKATRHANNSNQTESTKLNAERVWRLATPAPYNHPYLIKKQISPNRIGVLGEQYRNAPYKVQNNGNLLIIPIIDFSGTIWSIQFISESGKKAYLYGSRKKGSCFWLNGNNDIVYLCEGVATGISLHQDTQHSVACALDSHSLIHVAEELIKRFDPSQIFVLADDDWQSPKNTGIQAAKKAAQAIGAQVRIPDFSGLPRMVKDSDYNDYCRLMGMHHG